MNLYEILGIIPLATQDEIHKAYLTKSKQYHPDKNIGADTTAKMQEINEAYETLSDPELRSNYDDSQISGRSAFTQSTATPGPVEPSIVKYFASATMGCVNSRDFNENERAFFQKCKDYNFKVFLVGDKDTRKSQLLLNLSSPNDSSSEYASTIEVDFKIRNVNCMGKQARIQLWDTASEERYSSITTSYYRSASAVIFTFDLENSASLSDLYARYAQKTQHANASMISVLVGTYSNKQNIKVSDEDIQAFVNNTGMDCHVFHINDVVSSEAFLNKLVTKIGMAQTPPSLSSDNKTGWWNNTSKWASSVAQTFFTSPNAREDEQTTTASAARNEPRNNG